MNQMLNRHTHLVISNFNTVPHELMSLGYSYTLYDQSSDTDVVQELKNLENSNIIFCGKSKGHNLINYLDFIIENYTQLPEVVVFLKGNIVGRHCDGRWLMNSLLQNRYQFLWNDDEIREDSKLNYVVPAPGRFLEINNSWYVADVPHKYFVDLNRFLEFFFRDYKKSKYVMFSPGACYVVEKSRILNNPISVYKGLRLLIDYEFRPAEAFMLERSMNLLFDRTYEFQPYCYDFELLVERIRKLPNQSHLKKRKFTIGLFDKFLEKVEYELSRYSKRRSTNRNRLK
jgi:hypothetical protein